jgi:hypothetical protein
MPTLVKDARNRSPFWICCYSAADGRRLKKSGDGSEETFDCWSNFVGDGSEAPEMDGSEAGTRTGCSRMEVK